MQRGTTHSAATKQKMSDTQKRYYENGGVNPRKGATNSPETCAKLREIARIKRELFQQHLANTTKETNV